MRLRIFLVSLAVFSCGAGSPLASGGPPAGLTQNGRTLWQFEALLRDTFGARKVSAHGLDFVCASRLGCAPLSDWSPYFPTFANARHSAFHVTSRPASGGFGNYPQPITIRGKMVACDRAERRFLISYRDGVGLSPACLSRGR